MTYYQKIQKQLEEGQTIMNDANPNFMWYTVNRQSENIKHIVILENEKMTIKKYKNYKTYAVKVGQLLNRGY